MVSVVIVDDDEDTTEVLSEFFEMNNIEIVGIGNDGKQGVQAYLKHHPDVIISDIMMPEYDGFYLIKNILRRDPNAKIIVATADLTSETENRLKKIAPCAVMHKPYELSDLVEMVKTVGNGKEILNTQ